MDVWESFISVPVVEGKLLGLGNPLLDITVHGDLPLLKKYELNENEAILADKKHMELYEDVRKYKPVYTAGGSVQNSLRVFEWLTGKPHVAVFMGAVGTDEYGKILEDRAEGDGVLVRYQYHQDHPTGTCAVIVTNHHRSLVANLGAATHFQTSHIQTPENKAIVENADVYYISGFFLTVSPETVLTIAEEANQRDKLFVSNLSAVFICQHFSEVQTKVLPYVDVLFGNETEAVMFADVHAFNTTDLKEIATKLANFEKINKNTARTVIITQGSLPVIVAKNNDIKLIPVPVVAAEAIVDTNGAGDAFVGGFLSQLLQGQPVERCVDCGNWAAGQVIQRSGCTFDSDVKYAC